MIFDTLILVIGRFGYILFMLFFIAKVVLLLWYKKGSGIFFFQNFFYLRQEILISSREKQRKEWPFFKKTYNFLNAAVYISLGVWGILYFLIQYASK